MTKRDIGQEILDGIQEIKAFKAGQANLRTRTLTAPMMAIENNRIAIALLSQWQYT